MEPKVPSYLIKVCLGLSALLIGLILWINFGQFQRPPFDVSPLAAVNACLNAASASCLLLGFRAIRLGNWKFHRLAMLTALALSACFLVSYSIYHIFHGDTRFAGEGAVRVIYLAILLSHILLSVIALPLILITTTLALTERFSNHKAWARWTLPIWLYVSVTGVLIFILLNTLGKG